jgi:hypothetical protein
VITVQTFLIAAALVVTWGFYFGYTVIDYVKTSRGPNRRKGDLVASFRKMVVALCVWMLPLGVLTRTALVLAGFGDETAAQVLFFALVGTNIPGSIFVVVSLRFD